MAIYSLIAGLYLFGALIVIPFYTVWENRTYGRHQAALVVTSRMDQPQTRRVMRATLRDTLSARLAFVTRPLRIRRQLTSA